MKIAWCTPYGPHSAIARFSSAITAELQRRGHEIAIVRLDIYAAELPPPLDPTAVHENVPEDADVVVVNFGNYADFHARAIEIIAEHPACFILHDAEMRNFAWEMQHHFGFVWPALPFADQDPAADLLSDDLVHPHAAQLLRTIGAMASACIVHGPHYRQPVADTCPGTVAVLPLCYVENETVWSESPPESHDTFNILVFGMLNPNKQLDRVLRAAALMDDGGKPVQIILSGLIEPRYRSLLIDLCGELGLPEPLFTGRLDDENLSKVLSRSDVICCLRKPVTEGGSASVATAMHHARPVILSDVASFSMIPDDYAFKVSYGDDPHDLARILAEIRTDPDAGHEKALRAKAWASTQFGAKHYVDELEGVLADTIRIRPLIDAARMSSNLARNTLGADRLEAIRTVSGVLDELTAWSPDIDDDNSY